MSMNAEASGGSFTDSARRYAMGCLQSIERTFRPNLPLYVAAVVFLLYTFSVAFLYRIPLSLAASENFLFNIPIFVMIVIGAVAARRLFVMILREKPASPLSAMGGWLVEGFAAGDRPGNIFHAIVTFTPLMVAFAALKQAIPLIKPFSFDTTFSDWDRFLFFGHQPWELLQTFLGVPIVTSAITFVYNFWLALIFFCLFWQAFNARTSVTRIQFLLAFAFTWVIAGNSLAVLLSSAGPCFYGRLGLAPDVYAAQMDYLRAAAAEYPVWSVRVQDALWQSYVTGDGAINGISAMPSVHVTASVTMAFLAWRTNRIAGIGFTLFAIVIVIGSVHLAWHYAVDSIAGIVLGTVFWLAAGVIARRWLARFPQSDAGLAGLPASRPG